MPLPTCAALLANYNHATYLPQVLDMALQQTVPFNEIVIVDDASTDNSVEVIESRIRDVPHARLIKNPHNTGVERAFNAGLQTITSDYVYFMSADDIYNPQIVEWCQEMWMQYSDIAMISGNARVRFSQTGKERGFVLPLKSGYRTRKDIAIAGKMTAFTFYGGANVLRMDAVREADNMIVSLKWHADWFLYMVLASRYPFAVVPHEFVCVRQGTNQHSHARHDWRKQKPVIEYLLHHAKERYPDTYALMRENALLPTYNIETLVLLLKDETVRDFLTPLLMWRLLSYKLLRLPGNLLPDVLRAKVRQWFKI